MSTSRRWAAPPQRAQRGSWPTSRCTLRRAGLGGRLPMMVAGDMNMYMNATTDPATEKIRSGWEACGFRTATAGGTEDMTPTLHPFRQRVDTFLVKEPLLRWS